LTALADLAGIAGGVHVSQAVHRATIRVDETGSEAAAVTGIAIVGSARLGTPTTMRVDRPFAWAVVHEPTQTPVFVGHVVDPTT
jgi:serpin B